jgi:hypothetical protein
MGAGQALALKLGWETILLADSHRYLAIVRLIRRRDQGLRLEAGATVQFED